jgi:hypothetical protein
MPIGSRVVAGVVLLAVAGGLALVVARRDADQRREIARLTAAVASKGRESQPNAAPAVATVDPALVEAIASRAAELAAARAVASAGPAEPERKEAAEHAPSAEAQASLADAQRTLEDAIARGRLGRADVARIRRELNSAAEPGSAAEMARRIAVAVNAGALVVEDPGDMFP